MFCTRNFSTYLFSDFKQKLIHVQSVTVSMKQNPKENFTFSLNRSNYGEQTTHVKKKKLKKEEI